MLRPGQTIQLTVVALLGIAVVMVISAGMTVGDVTGTGQGGGFDAGTFLSSQAVQYAVASFVLMTVASRINLRHLASMPIWRNPVTWAMGVSLVLVVLTWVPGLGLTINGARRWLPLYPGASRTFQPRELV